METTTKVSTPKGAKTAVDYTAMTDKQLFEAALKKWKTAEMVLDKSIEYVNKHGVYVYIRVLCQPSQTESGITYKGGYCIRLAANEKEAVGFQPSAKRSIVEDTFNCPTSNLKYIYDKYVYERKRQHFDVLNINEVKLDIFK